MTAAMNITQVTPSNEQLAIDILVQAFQDDPVLKWIADRPTFLPLFFDLTIRSLLPNGLTYMTSDGNGAASWLLPDTKIRWPLTPGNILKLLKSAGFAGAYRLLLSAHQTEKHHPAQSHYYLFAIGALPDKKGRGIGTKLIQQVLRQCDKDGKPAYLENSRPENLGFYCGHGFEVIQQISFAKSAPPLWLMWREPRQTPARANAGDTPAQSS